MIEPNNIYLGNCYELIKQVEDKSIDCIYTNIPYLFDGVAVIGIEVLNNKLRQVRTKYNGQPTKKQNKIVKKWFEQVVLA